MVFWAKIFGKEPNDGLELKDRKEPPYRGERASYYESKADAMAGHAKYREWMHARNAELAAGRLNDRDAAEFIAIVEREHAGWKRLADEFRQP